VPSPAEVSDKEGVNLLGVKGDMPDSSILFNVGVVFFSSVLTLN